MVLSHIGEALEAEEKKQELSSRIELPQKTIKQEESPENAKLEDANPQEDAISEFLALDKKSESSHPREIEGSMKMVEHEDEEENEGKKENEEKQEKGIDSSPEHNEKKTMLKPMEDATNKPVAKKPASCCCTIF